MYVCMYVDVYVRVVFSNNMEILMLHLRDVCVDVCVCAVPVLLQHLHDVCMYVCTYVCMYVCMHACMHGWMDVCIYVFM